MIPYDLDPSLHTGKPEPEVLDDGFSPPTHGEPAPAGTPPLPMPEAPPVDPALWAKSEF